jgi:2-methylcitrate dehydratase
VAADPRIDALREKMTVKENPRFTEEYFDADKRAIGNAVQVFFTDGSSTEQVSIDYPVGHRRRRDEGIPLLEDKFERAIRGYFSKRQADGIMEAMENRAVASNMDVHEFGALWSLI